MHVLGLVTFEFFSFFHSFISSLVEDEVPKVYSGGRPVGSGEKARLGSRGYESRPMEACDDSELVGDGLVMSLEQEPAGIRSRGTMTSQRA